MSKKQKVEQRPKEKVVPVVEDFYTAALDKRKGYFVKKIDEINLLESADPKTLKPDQHEKIRSRPAAQEKIKYYDDIKQFYFEACAKKGPTPEASASKMMEMQDGLMKDVIGLISMGQAIRNFEKNSKSFEQVFNSDQMTSIQELFASLNAENAFENMAESKAKLQDYIKNESLKSTVEKFLMSPKVEEVAPVKEAEPVKEEIQEEKETETSNKLGLFAHADEDESEEEETPVQEKAETKENKPENNETESGIPMGFLKPLPEGDEKKTEEFKTHKKPRRPNNKGDFKGRSRRNFNDGDKDNTKREPRQNEDGTPAEGKPQFQNRRGPRDRNFSDKGDFDKKERFQNEGKDNFNRGSRRNNQRNHESGNTEYRLKDEAQKQN